MNDFLEKHYKAMVMVALILILGVGGFGSIARVVMPNAATLTEEVMTVLVSDIIASAIEPVAADVQILLDDRASQPDVYVNCLARALNRCSTAEEVNSQVDVWKNQNWDFQLDCMDWVDQNKESREALESRVLYPDVYLAFMKRVYQN